MQIAFISLMRISPWGGSEELWFRAALLAIQRGHSVTTVTQLWKETPSKIVELASTGATTKFYRSNQPNLTVRAIQKAVAWTAPSVKFPLFEADLVVISAGTTWDLLYQRAIVTEVLKANKPYVLISQHGFENGSIISSADRPYLLDVIRKAEAFFFVAARNLEAAERQLVYLIGNARLVSNPLNTQQRTSTAFPKTNILRLACVARLECAFKGQDLLLQALSQGQWPTRSYTLKLFGGGPDRDYLSQLIEFYKLTDKVTIEGHVNDLDSIWRQNQVQVICSLSEGTPLSLVEAMIAGRPVLATDVGDNAKYVRTGHTGVLISAATVACISAGLEQVWENKDKLEEMGINAQSHSESIADLHPDATLLNFIESV